MIVFTDFSKFNILVLQKFCGVFLKFSYIKFMQIFLKISLKLVTVSKWVKTFSETSAATSVGGGRKEGRKRSVGTIENCKKVRVAVKVALGTLLRRHTSSLLFSLGRAHWMLKHDLGYHPYKVQIVQELRRNWLSQTERFLQTVFAFAIIKTFSFSLKMRHTSNWMDV